ncbi:mannosyltransferase [Friedmanniomyces endolithicus]|uniref:Mannosyltransferase n=1 Tax=Friedmanniomyces endolithicus TaxID=329885 RepID=A0AAN6J746_9PEZI|nr:mannosyltransferase [Friedmanniomyces endolithicus]
MTIGKPGTLAARIHTVDEVGKPLEIFQSHKVVYIDSARLYGSGTTEKMLGDTDYIRRGLVMDTKLYPSAKNALSPPEVRYWLTPEDIRSGFFDGPLQLLRIRESRFGSTSIDRWTDEAVRLHRAGSRELWACARSAPYSLRGMNHSSTEVYRSPQI